MFLIKCSDVSFAYEGRVAAAGLNFELDSGDYLCVVGKNGSGKSTLLNGILRLKQPLGGELLFDKDLKQNEVGYLSQNNAGQKNFPAGVYEIVLSGRLNCIGARPFYSKADKEAAEKNMRLLDIQHIRSMRFGELSGGQQRRVLLARALCSAKKLLLLDEPAAGLDTEAQKILYGHISDINNNGMTVIMVSHDVHNALKYASHILHLENEQVFFGTAAAYSELAANGGLY